MTVRDLIELLSDKDPSLDVILDGCDCLGRAYSIEVQGKYLTIRREFGSGYDPNHEEGTL